MILCTTNILIEFYKNNDHITQELQQIGQPQLAISVISQAELYFGARDKIEMAKLKKHLSLLHHFPLDTATSSTAVHLMESYALNQHLRLPDAFIAATAVTHAIPLYTLNPKAFDFIAHLKLYQPVTY